MRVLLHITLNLPICTLLVVLSYFVLTGTFLVADTEGLRFCTLIILTALGTGISYHLRFNN